MLLATGNLVGIVTIIISGITLYSNYRRGVKLCLGGLSLAPIVAAWASCICYIETLLKLVNTIAKSVTLRKYTQAYVSN